MTDISLDPRLRLCVVQLDGIPRAYTSHHNLWMPAEPLVDPRKPAKLSLSLPRLSARSLFAVDNHQVYKNIYKLSEAAAASHLKEIIAFLSGHDVDVAVFPEYMTPVSCLPDLVDFSRGRAVVAGLEHVRRSDDAEYLASSSAGGESPEDLMQRNVSVLVADSRIYLITKKQPSEGETIRPGSGPIVKEVRLRDRKVLLGVAVCMDYLRLEEEARKRAPEIVCIPAYSPKVDPFIPDAPRDYVRLFSNGAAYGGSQIMVPGLPGDLTDDLGVQPIQSGFEAIILIAYDQYPKRPTGYIATNNRLLLRAEVVERTPANGVALNAIEDLAAYAAAKDWPAARLQKLFTAWLDHIPVDSPMGEIFEVYRDFLAQGTEDETIAKLASSHLAIDPDKRPSAVRREQARYIISQLHSLTSVGKLIGEAQDLYSRLYDSLSGIVSNSAALHAPAHVATAPPSPSGSPEAMKDPITDMDISDESASSGNGKPFSVVRSIDSDNFESIILDPDFRPVEAERLRMCQAIEVGAQRVLNAMNRLSASASPDDLQTAAQVCRLRVAAVADLLTQVTGLTPVRSDFEWANAIGIVGQDVAQLQEKLPSDDSAARLVMSWRSGCAPLVEIATHLHEATMRLKRLAE